MLQDELNNCKRKLAETAISKEQDMLSSHNELKSILEESIRKELNY